MTLAESQYLIKAMDDIKADLSSIKREQKEMRAEMQGIIVDIAVMKTKAAIYSGVASFVIVVGWSFIEPLFKLK